MPNITTVKSTVMKAAGRGGLIARKYSPEILMTVGVVGIITGTIMACKATLKADAIVVETKENINKIKYVNDHRDELKDDQYTEQDYKKDLSITYIKSGVKFVKLYAPAAAVTLASIGCILGSHNIMKKRNVALIAAYRLVEQSFNDYRQRVIDEYGKEKDRQFKYGIKAEQVTATEVDENGKKKKVKKTVETVDPTKHSQYAKFFDEACVNWSKTPEYNLMFLRTQQNYANDLLKARGHVFLNEVYDMIGVPRTQAGAVVGWVISKDGDNFIDFGMYDMEDGSVRDFVNGYERSILLDFNVDGVIYDLI